MIAKADKPLIAKHALFVTNLFKHCMNATKAYSDTYPDAGDSAKQSSSALMTNPDIKAEITRRQAEEANKLNLSRASQHLKLQNALTFAIRCEKPSAMVSAIREQNEMLGYHRDKAPNAEREASTLARMSEQELRIASAVACMLAHEESLERPALETGAKYTESEVIDADGPS